MNYYSPDDIKWNGSFRIICDTILHSLVYIPFNFKAIRFLEKILSQINWNNDGKIQEFQEFQERMQEFKKLIPPLMDFFKEINNNKI